MSEVSGENIPARKVNTKYIVRLAFLFTIMVVMSLTPAGYLKIGIISVSFLCLPVILAAVMLGPLASTILGFAFGISSFIAAFSDTVGIMLLDLKPSTAPFLLFLALVIPRLLMGFVTGLIFKMLSSIKKTRAASYLITSISASLLNSILYTVFMWFLFGEELIQLGLYPLGTTVLALLIGLVGFNTLLELLVCGLFGFAAGRIVLAVNKRTEKKRAAAEPENNGAIVHDAFEIPALPEQPAVEEQPESENPET